MHVASRRGSLLGAMGRFVDGKVRSEDGAGMDMGLLIGMKTGLKTGPFRLCGTRSRTQRRWRQFRLHG